MDKYLDTRRPVASAADRAATDHSRRRNHKMADCPSFWDYPGEPVPER